MNNDHLANAENPGFLIRRLQQISASIFLSRLRQFRLTPIQYTILRVVESRSGIDQRSVATLAALDASTTTDVLARLAARKLVKRSPGKIDRRTRVVELTAAGRQLLQTVRPFVRAAQGDLLQPLSAARRKTLLAAIIEVLEAHQATETAGGKGPWRRLR